MYTLMLTSLFFFLCVTLIPLQKTNSLCFLLQHNSKEFHFKIHHCTFIFVDADTSTHTCSNYTIYQKCTASTVICFFTQHTYLHFFYFYYGAQLFTLYYVLYTAYTSEFSIERKIKNKNIAREKCIYMYTYSYL